jgi:hypothetical protein
MKLFTKGNRKLPKSTLIWNLPTEITCMGATKECKKHCYAKKAERMYPQVLPFRMKNYAISKLKEFKDIVINELCNIKSDIWNTLRIFEAGDFYSQEHLNDWNDITKSFQDKMFYAYTKSKGLDFTDRAKNFIVIVSNDKVTEKDIEEYKKTFNGVATIETKLKGFFNCPMDCKICNYCYSNPDEFKKVNFKRH